jgi:hypothetical protein
VFIILFLNEVIRPLSNYNTLFYTYDCLLLLYFTLSRPTLEHAFFVWNSIPSTDSKMLEQVQRKCVSLCENVFSHADCSYDDSLLRLKVHKFQMRKRDLDAHCLLISNTGFKNCPSLLDYIGLRVPVHNVTDSPCCLLNIASPSARCVKAAKSFCREVERCREPHFKNV